MITAIKWGPVAFVLFALAYAVGTRANLIWSHPTAGREFIGTRP
jgi:hypothetical protein